MFEDHEKLALAAHIKKHTNKKTNRIDWSVIFDNGSVRDIVSLNTKYILLSDIVINICPYKINIKDALPEHSSISYDDEMDESFSWLAENCIKGWMYLGAFIWFREEKDAVFFRLWLS